jgi:cytochrome b561
MRSTMATLQSSRSTPSADGWPRVVIALHWLTAFALLCVFTLVIAREWVDQPGWDRALLSSHRLAGLVAFVIVVARLACRIATRRPTPSSTGFAFVATRCVHALLYLLLVASPVLGYLLTSARLGHVDLFGLHLPSLIARDRGLAETLESLHHLCGWSMLGLIAAHTAAALWHHLVTRDKVLIRMLPRSGRLHSPTTESP